MHTEADLHESGTQRWYAAVDDELLPLDTASVSLNDSWYAYGFGVYETLKLREGFLYFLEEHLERLRFSAEQIDLKMSSKTADLRRRIWKVIDASGLENANIRILLIKAGDGCRSYIYPSEIPRIAADVDDEFPQPIGVHLMLYQGERHFPRAKSLSMLMSSVALDRAKKEGCWDALLYDRDGEILEGSRCNFYWFEDDGLFSPSEERILHGVTRQNIIRCLGEHGLDIRQGRLSRESLIERPRSLMVSSTSIALQPVLSISDPLSGTRVTLPADHRVEEYSRWFSVYLRDYRERLFKGTV